MVPFPMEGHVGDQPCEFFIRLRRPPRHRLRLPAPFAREMERDPPQSLRLHMRGCGNGGTRVDVDFPAPRVMYLRRGWKTFARIHSLMAGLFLYYKLMEDGLLSVKVFGDFGTRLSAAWRAPLTEIPTMEALPRAKVMRRTAGQMTATSPTRRWTPRA